MGKKFWEKNFGKRILGKKVFRKNKTFETTEIFWNFEERKICWGEKTYLVYLKTFFFINSWVSWFFGKKFKFNEPKISYFHLKVPLCINCTLFYLFADGLLQLFYLIRALQEIHTYHSLYVIFSRVSALTSYTKTGSLTRCAPYWKFSQV